MLLGAVLIHVNISKPWRAATLCPFGGLDLYPSVEALVKNGGKNRILQAIELESGPGHQWRLWKWASYCASEVGLKGPPIREISFIFTSFQCMFDSDFCALFLFIRLYLWL
jgi:hypothetical protein